MRGREDLLDILTHIHERKGRLRSIDQRKTKRRWTQEKEEEA